MNEEIIQSVSINAVIGWQFSLKLLAGPVTRRRDPRGCVRIRYGTFHVMMPSPKWLLIHAAPRFGIAVEVELDRVRFAEPGCRERHRVRDPEAELIRHREGQAPGGVGAVHPVPLWRRPLQTPASSVRPVIGQLVVLDELIERNRERLCVGSRDGFEFTHTPLDTILRVSAEPRAADSDAAMDLLDKLRAVDARKTTLVDGRPFPGMTRIDEVLGPTEVMIGGRRTLMFGSNNYLGLTFHPEVVAAARAAAEQYGTSTTGSRVANGTLALHDDLERALAAWYGTRECLIFTTGYQANLSVVSGICGPEDHVLLDAACHASIYDGARLSQARTTVFRHNSSASLSRKLERLPQGNTNQLVVVEALYSLTGDLAPLAQIAALCRQHGAYLLVDEAHSLGAYGAGGRGWSEAQGILPQVDFIVGTFSKALAGVGGFCTSNHEALGNLRFLSRPYVFTASHRR